LVDDDDLVDQIEPGDALMRRRAPLWRVVEMALQRPHEDVVDQRRFAAAAGAGDAGEKLPERKGDREVLEVVRPWRREWCGAGR
jgi:hypothetical protein